jgi:hypothetical protein
MVGPRDGPAGAIRGDPDLYAARRSRGHFGVALDSTSLRLAAICPDNPRSIYHLEARTLKTSCGRWLRQNVKGCRRVARDRTG